MAVHGTCLSVGGHAVRPWINYRRPLRWYTMIREPVTRLISHYMFLHRFQRFDLLFSEWLEDTPRDRIGNIQVRFIAGDYDCEKAKKMIRSRFVSIGLQEYLRESIEHLAVADGWDYGALPDKPLNVSQDDALYRQVQEELPDLKDKIDELTSEDHKLYRWVVEEIWPQQMQVIEKARHGGRTIVGSARPEDIQRCKEHLRYRRYAYKPFVFAARSLLPLWDKLNPRR